MKVTLFTKEYPPHVYGGAGVHVKFLAKELARIMDVDVRCFGEQDSREAHLSAKGYAPWDQLKGAQKFSPVLETLSVNLLSQCESLDADVVHTHTWYAHFAGLLAKTLYGVPFVATCHSLEPLRPWKEEQLGRGYALSTWIEKICIESADKVVAVSRQMKADILEHFKIPADKVEVIHNGIDLDLWSKRPLSPALKAAWGIADDYVLFLGRCTKQKGVEHLVDAAADIPCQVVMAMGGADTKDYEALITEKLKGKKNIVHINKMLSEDEAAQLYSQARACICPSIYEPFGIINLEAMAWQAPVIASSVGGIVEIVEQGETGLLIEPGVPAQISAAVRRLLEHPEE
ncbi:MAG TPA: glycogen synthase, partial [bacterium]|nr:glycogen synthase [bacterium]